MARKMGSTQTGFSWTITDGGTRFMVGKSAVHDAHAWADLDGDGCIDLVAIATASGNYEDTDHELVAIHVPSGNVGWRALPGEVSKKVSIVEGVVVASTNAAQRLRGLDPRTGQQLWDTALPDRLTEDPFDGDDRAPAIAAIGGGLAAFECKDGSWHMLDVRTGQIVKSGEGKFAPLGGGVLGLVAFSDDNDDLIEVWDTQRNRSVVKLKDVSQLCVVPGASAFALVMRGQVASSGAHGVLARFFDNATMVEVGKTVLRGAAGAQAPARDDDDDDDDDSDAGSVSVEVGEGQYGTVSGYLLGGNRMFFGGRYQKGPWVGQVAPKGHSDMRLVPTPKPGFKFRTIGWVSPSLVTVWEKDKGTPKLTVVGHHPDTLAPIWQSDDLGGRSVDTALHTTGTAILVPCNPGPNHNEYDQAANKCCIRQLDPSTGATVTEYPVEDVECVEVHGKFLCGASTYFSGGLPVVYDTDRRERIL